MTTRLILIFTLLLAFGRSLHAQDNGNCDGLTGITVGSFVSVTAGQPNNVRSVPDLESEIIGQFPTGAVAQIIGGPICSDGFRWWRISNEVLSGWTAEGDDGVPWLAHLTQSPFLNNCPLPPRLISGQQGRVLPGDPNALRNGPDTSNTQVIGRILGNERFWVLGPSICGTDRRRWYPVNANGILGWTAEGENATYWVEPLPSDLPPIVFPDPTTVDCNLPSRISVGDFVTLSPGPSNNIRLRPSLDANVIGSFSTGNLMQVIGGSVCANGLRWWRVADALFNGWTAEAGDTEYWLIPLVQSPFLNNCPLPPRLITGNQARVLPGEPNVIRNGPDVSGTQVIGRIPGSAEILVLGTSLCGTDGRRWYPISYNGTLGWTAEGEANTYWIEPR